MSMELLHFNGSRVNAVVLGMGADELDVDRLEAESYSRDRNRP